MKITKTSNYYAEDLVPYDIVRKHLRYNYGEAEELIETYMGAAVEYMRAITDRVFCSSTPATTEVTESDFASQAAKLATVTVYFDDADIGSMHKLHNVTGDYTVDTFEYLDNTGAWQPMTTGRVRNTGYPIQVDLQNASLPADRESEYDYDLIRLVLLGGDNVKDLPKQYTQAALLLVGHYDTQREAEFLGGITTEVKEGVARLISSVRHF
jgi:hypothetical protein